MTLINKIIHVSGVQLYNASSVYCTACSPSPVKSAPITIYLSTLSSMAPNPTPHHNHPGAFFFSLNSSTPNPTPPTAVSLLSICESVSLFCFITFHIWMKSYKIIEYYSAIKKKILPFETAWMNLEIFTLSEISQSEEGKANLFISLIACVLGILSKKLMLNLRS